MSASAAPDDGPFYMENGCWPYVHSIVPMAMIGFQIFPTEVHVIILLAAAIWPRARTTRCSVTSP